MYTLQKKMEILIIFICMLTTVACSTRSERIWPLSNSTTVDLGQSSPFGPRLQASQSYRYDFHRGVDIPTDDGTPLHAIDDGVVKLAGYHRDYSDGVIQIQHEGWDENSDIKFYSNYLHIDNATGQVLVSINEHVTKGQHIGYSWHSANLFEHLHFEIRVGGRFQRHCCNPWKYLPGPTTFNISISLTLDSNTSIAIVNVSVAPDQLTFNRIELHVNNNPMVYDMCEHNLDHTFSELDNPQFENFLVVSPARFNSKSYDKGEHAKYGFVFRNISAAQGDVIVAKAFDVFGNVVTSSNSNSEVIANSGQNPQTSYILQFVALAAGVTFMNLYTLFEASHTYILQ